MKFLSQHPIVVLVVFYFLFFWCPQFLFTFGVPVKDLPGNTLAHDFLVRVWQIHSRIFLQIWIRILLPTFAFMDIYWCNIIAFFRLNLKKFLTRYFTGDSFTIWGCVKHNILFFSLIFQKLVYHRSKLGKEDSTKLTLVNPQHNLLIKIIKLFTPRSVWQFTISKDYSEKGKENLETCGCYLDQT